MLKEKILQCLIKTGFPVFLFLLILNSGNANAKLLKVVTTSTDLKSIAEYIGGNKIKVESIIKGYANPHEVDPKPSFMVKLSKADVFIRIGLDLESWAQLLIDGARNSKIRLGEPGHVIASVGVDLQGLAVRGGVMIDRSLGDIHIYGNPHFWLDPLNGKIKAQNILDGLKKNSPENAAYFEGNKKRFDREINIHMIKWVEKMKPYFGTNVIAYHRSWPNFSKRFGINIAGYVEVRPGIAPSPAHIATLIKRMKSEDIRVLIREPCYETKIPKFISSKTGATVLTLPVSVEGVSEVKNYFDLFDYIIDNLVSTFEKQEIIPHD
ncbi:periplasmic component/surface adhesin [Candidatus Scalindua japonica]|uniref:Periplasmic component/surface adhesin n=1 Tax=Candidatus Scalindua japonica TaxID=1284222 RepID=A0A286U3R1_9BACT|nr:metal ABC transporter substrate-binding protein [Candidatus Scalindua japonica]GAX62711.1 periplasmic component/surface adhesin [Candidatus Scalindua japonica]